MDAHMRTLFLISILLVSATTSRADDNVRTTRPLPKFTLQSVDDTKLSSTNFTGKTMIIWFFASWDKPCRQQLPALLELQKEYGTNDFTVLGVSLDSKGPVGVKKFAIENSITFPIAMADLEFIQNCGSLTAVPTMLIIEPHGQIINRYVGITERAVLEIDIKALLNISKD